MARAAEILDYMARNFVAADFADEQIPGRTVLKIAVPRGTPVSVDLVQTVERAMQREPGAVHPTPVPDFVATLSVLSQDSKEK